MNNFTLLLFMVLNSFYLATQEKLPLDEIVRFFPEGKYSEIEHIDLDAARNSGLWEDYLVFAWSNEDKLRNNSNLPRSLYKNLSTVTHAKLASDEIVELQTLTLEERKHVSISVEIDGKHYCNLPNKARLSVYRFYSSINLKKNLSESNYLRVPGGKIGDMKLSFFKIPGNLKLPEIDLPIQPQMENFLFQQKRIF